MGGQREGLITGGSLRGYLLRLTRTARSFPSPQVLRALHIDRGPGLSE